VRNRVGSSRSSINKSIKGDLDKYCDLLTNATFHLLPTKSDAAPLTIIECGYFGTPSIAPNKFAISELISDGVSGYLLPEEFDSDAIVQTASIYLRMTNQEKFNIRESTFAFYKSKSWDSVINNIISILK
jgi:glycosyltransferase involved in cell wall biosynthesis